MWSLLYIKVTIFKGLKVVTFSVTSFESDHFYT